MSNLNELYQQVILDHNKHPKNFGELAQPCHFAEGHNPLCGDHVDVYLKIEDGIIEDIKFKGDGCAISKASTSIMTTILKGKSVESVSEYLDIFQDLVTNDIPDEKNKDKLGKLAVFRGVHEFPTRIKCATLAWHTVSNAINSDQPPQA